MIAGSRAALVLTTVTRAERGSEERESDVSEMNVNSLILEPCETYMIIIPSIRYDRIVVSNRHQASDGISYQACE